MYIEALIVYDIHKDFVKISMEKCVGCYMSYGRTLIKVISNEYISERSWSLGKELEGHASV